MSVTLDRIRDIARDSALQASSTTLSDVRLDRAVAFVFNRVLEETQADTAQFDHTLTGGSRTTDITSSEADFEAHRFLGGWANDRVVGLTAYTTVANYHDTRSQTGEPEFLAFLTDDEAHLWPTPGSATTLTVKWFKPLVDWTWGTASPENVTLNVPRALAYEAAWFGVPSAAMFLDPAVLTNSPGWNLFLDALARYRSHYSVDRGVLEPDMTEYI